MRALAVAAFVAMITFLDAAAVSLAAESSSNASSNSFAIRHVDVFDGKAVRRAQDVIIRDGLITAVGAHLPIPSGLAVTEGAGKMLLPGLIDAHVHSWSTSRSDALRFGVTTELDMYMDWHLLAGAGAQRVSLARTDKADLWSAGTLATAPGGHGTEYGGDIPTLTAASQAQSWVEARIREGSDYIKIIVEPGSARHPLPTLSPEIVTALVSAAHQNNKMALVHVQNLESARLALSAGADGLAHVFWDQPADEACIKLARQRHLFVVSTLSVWSGYVCGPIATSLAKDPAIEPYLSGEQAASLAAKPRDCSGNALEGALTNTRLLHQAGIPLLAGTDAGNPATAHGVSLLGEIELLVKAGLTPVEALAAATSIPAEHFRLTDRGRIARGTRADMLLVDGDPTRDPAMIRHIAAIWMNGYLVQRDKPAASDAANGYPAKYELVQGAQRTVYAGHITPGGATGVLEVTLGGDEHFKGEYAPASAADADKSAAPDLSKDWDLIYGPGYYDQQVKGNRLYSRALMVSNSGATLVTEFIGDNSDKFTGAARDSRGNLYKVSFGD